jgi:hypothetical protein
MEDHLDDDDDNDGIEDILEQLWVNVTIMRINR